jgi:hypothetical protein
MSKKQKKQPELKCKFCNCNEEKNLELVIITTSLTHFSKEDMKKSKVIGHVNKEDLKSYTLKDNFTSCKTCLKIYMDDILFAIKGGEQGVNDD